MTHECIFHWERSRSLLDMSWKSLIWLRRDFPGANDLTFQHIPLQLRHNEHDDVSNHQPGDCLLSRLLRRRSKKTSKLRVTGLCARNSPVTGEIPAQRASNAENVPIWWRHYLSEKHWLREWLVPDGTKLLPEPMFINHQWGLVAFIWGHFHLGTLKIFTWYELKFTYLRLQRGLPGANELTFQHILFVTRVSLQALQQRYTRGTVYLEDRQLKVNILMRCIPQITWYIGT